MESRRSLGSESHSDAPSPASSRIVRHGPLKHVTGHVSAEHEIHDPHAVPDTPRRQVNSDRHPGPGLAQAHRRMLAPVVHEDRYVTLGRLRHTRTVPIVRSLCLQCAQDQGSARRQIGSSPRANVIAAPSGMTRANWRRMQTNRRARTARTAEPRQTIMKGSHAQRTIRHG